MKKIKKIIDNFKNISDFKFYLIGGISLIMLSIVLHLEIGFAVCQILVP